MRLRTNIRAPVRYEGGGEEDSMVKQHATTKPAFPNLLRQQVVPFNKENGSAAFPSLPLAFSGVSSTSPPSPQARNPRPATRDFTGGQSTTSFTVPDHSAFTGWVDYHDTNYVTRQSQAMSNDEFHDFELDPNNLGAVAWASLELSTQYQIFTRISSLYDSGAAKDILGLSEADILEVQDAISRRNQTPYASAEACQYLQSGYGIDPQLIAMFSRELLYDARYDEAYPISIQRARMYLEQHNLVPSLVGEWCLNPDGSGMLICIDSSISPSPQNPRHSLQDSVADSSEVSAFGPVALLPVRPPSFETVSQIPTKRQREPSMDKIDVIPQGPMAELPKKAPKKFPLHTIHVAQESATVQASVTHPRSQPQDVQKKAFPAVHASKHRTLAQPPIRQSQKPPTLPEPSISSAKPLPLQTGQSAATAASNTPLLIRNDSEAKPSDQRMAGRMSLRRRGQLRPSEKHEKMMPTPDIPSETSESEEDRIELRASLSSPFVTLNTKRRTNMTVNKDGRAEVSSSPTVQHSHKADQRVHRGPSMQFSPLARHRSLPPNAVEAINENRRQSSGAFQSANIAATLQEPSSMSAQMMQHPSLYTECFKKMPAREQERLLTIQPPHRNVVQTWLIYGVEAWNKDRPWNTRFPDKQHVEPGHGEALNPQRAGSVLGKSIVHQWNFCRKLGLGNEFFVLNQIGERVIQCYDALSRTGRALAAGGNKYQHISETGASGGPAVLAKIKAFRQMYLRTEINFWQMLKGVYLTGVAGPNKEWLEAMPNQRVVFFDYRGPMQSTPNTPASHRLPRPSTPIQASSPLRGDAFTTKALGLGTPHNQGTMMKTPSSRDLGHFGQGSAEGEMHPDPFSIGMDHEESPLKNRGASSQIKKELAAHDTRMKDPSPSVRTQIHAAETKGTPNPYPAGRLAAIKPPTAPNSASSMRKASTVSPAFSPINDQEINPFFANTASQQARDAADLMYKVTAARSDPISATIRPSNDPQWNRVAANESYNVNEVTRQRDDKQAPAPNLAENAGSNTLRDQSRQAVTTLESSLNGAAHVGTPALSTFDRQQSPSRQSTAATVQSKKPKKEKGTHHPSTRARTAFRNTTPSDGTRSQTPDISLHQSVLNATLQSHAAGLLIDGTKVTKKPRGKGKPKSKLKIEADVEADVEADEETDPIASRDATSPPATKKKVKAKARSKSATPKIPQTEKDTAPDQPTPNTTGKGSRRPRGPYKKKKAKEEDARRAEEQAGQAD